MGRRTRNWAGASLMTAVIAATVVATAAGCGMVKVGYRNGDTVGLIWVNRYFDLTSEQEAFVKPRLHALLGWHRQTQLPDYAKFGGELQQRATRPITATEVETVGLEAQRRGMATIDHALPDLADLALRLTPDNVKALQKKFEADDEKWRNEFMKGDVDRQLKARYEKTLERVEEWYGRFSSEQRDRIRALSDARPFNNDVFVAERERRQRELVALLSSVIAEKPARDVVVTRLRGYADRFDHNPDSERRAFLESYRKATYAMDAAIHNQATPEQKKRAVGKLQDWIDDFRSLAADTDTRS